MFEEIIAKNYVFKKVYDPKQDKFKQNHRQTKSKSIYLKKKVLKNILKAATEKLHITYKEIMISMTESFHQKNIEARRLK